MTIDAIDKFILSGKPVFTIRSTKIDKRFTYKIRRDKNNKDRFFAMVMFGSDNEKDYRFLGWFYRDNWTLKHSGKSCDTDKSERFQMLKYFLQFICDNHIPETCEFFPSGNCGRCGRLLTTPESIERGIGPECWAKETGEAC